MALSLTLTTSVTSSLLSTKDATPNLSVDSGVKNSMTAQYFIDTNVLHYAEFEASRRVRNHVNSPPREFSFDVKKHKPLRFRLPSQYGIQVGKRESTHKQVRLFT